MNKPPHCQFFTPGFVAELLVRNIPKKIVSRVLDLGIGNGALSKAARDKWKKSKIFSVDIEEQDKYLLSTENHFFSKFNVLNTEAFFNKYKNHNFGVALCNPPFGIKVESTPYINKILFDNKLHSQYNKTHHYSEIIFLGVALQLLRKSGVGGFILPNRILVGNRYIELRKDLINSNMLISVINLGPNVFENTEVESSLLIISKDVQKRKSISLSYLDKNGKMSKRISLSKKKAIERCDYHYHSAKLNKSTIQPYVKKIFRGSKNKLTLMKEDYPFFHTTTFSNNGNLFCKKPIKNGHSDSIAEKGDILIARVGTRNIGKVYFVKNPIIISDCIICLRLKNGIEKKVYNQMNSEKGKKWFRVNAKGSCAKYLTQKDIINFPLDV